MWTKNNSDTELGWEKEEQKNYGNCEAIEKSDKIDTLDILSVHKICINFIRPHRAHPCKEDLSKYLLHLTTFENWAKQSVKETNKTEREGESETNREWERETTW